MVDNKIGSRVTRRVGTKSAMHKRCQCQTKGAANRARKTLPGFRKPKVLHDVILMSKEQFDNLIGALDKEIS